MRATRFRVSLHTGTKKTNRQRSDDQWRRCYATDRFVKQKPCTCVPKSLSHEQLTSLSVPGTGKGKTYCRPSAAASFDTLSHKRQPRVVEPGDLGKRSLVAGIDWRLSFTLWLEMYVCVYIYIYMVPPPRVIYPFGGEIVCILPLSPSLVQGLLCMCVCVHSEPPCMCSTKAIAQMVEYIVFAQSVSPIELSRVLKFNPED